MSQSKTNNRVTFAIISHPDAGKTTLTEQFLLEGNVIRESGTVKGRGSSKFASSDWMEIEKQRGISVTSSVLQFEHNGKKINIVDTPGHNDFSEDTFRTLMAVDSVIMVIDSSKGIESQTKKLFEIVKKRKIPIFTFFNKIDRDAKDPMELIDELESTLDIKTYPRNWPIGSGQFLKGTYNFKTNEIDSFNNSKDLSIEDDVKEDISLIKDINNDLTNIDEEIKKGDLTPVFFGSALKGFETNDFFNFFIDNAPSPRGKKLVNNETIEADDDKLSGFVFKIQSNMNPKHRDRIAFFRIVSGRFKKGMKLFNPRTKKEINLNNATQFVAESQQNVTEAVAGDIIGIYDTDNFQVGDSLFEQKRNDAFQPLLSFTPTIFKKVIVKNALKKKNFDKGLEQLVQEGTIQLFSDILNPNQKILGAVGILQFEVFKFRMENEYNVEIELENINNNFLEEVEDISKKSEYIGKRNIALEKNNGKKFLLFENNYAFSWFKQNYPKIDFVESN